MKIKVVTVAGKNTEISVDGNMTIWDLKQEFYRQEGVHMTHQRLLYHGQGLADNATIESLGIQEGETIHMVTSLRAGL
jgi:hypothetical protein